MVEPIRDPEKHATPRNLGMEPGASNCAPQGTKYRQEMNNNKRNDDFLRFLFDDEDDEDDTDLLQCLSLIAMHYIEEEEKQKMSKRKGEETQAPPASNVFFVRNRIEWDLHVTHLMEEGPNAFARLYRMPHASFVKLCGLIEPYVTIDVTMSKVRTGGKSSPITVEIILHCLLRWLGGGSYLDIQISAGISRSSFYRCIHSSMEAILLCDLLSIHFPTTEEELEIAVSDFKSLSTNGVIDGCVACVDGILLRIQTPASSETGNVKADFSGHYQAYGINVQAACDSRCRFVSVCIAAPGGCNDIAAYRKTPLAASVTKLALGKYIIGDNAYVCSESLLTPFAGMYASSRC